MRMQAKKVTIKHLDHPYIQEILTKLRAKTTQCFAFRQHLEEIGIFIAYEIARDLTYEEVLVETPLGVAKGLRLKDPIVVIGVLRAALPLVNGVLRVFKKAQLGIIAAKRIEDHRVNDNDFDVAIPYERTPDMNDKVVIIVDPMLATASTMIRILSRVKRKWRPKKIIVVSIVAAKYGVERLLKEHPDINLYVVAIDNKLNGNGYIVPGLGDAGDRAFCTE